MSTGIQWTDETKVCTHCGEAKPLNAFCVDRSRPDGLSYWCSPCRNERSRQRHVSRATGRPFGPSPLAERDGDAVQARRTINHLVETRRIPPPNDLPCTDCGHIWSPDERRHEYDHHRGYGAGSHRYVEPVCTTCHHARERARAV